MNKNHIVVKDDKVYFLRSGDIPGLVPLNFAACWAELLPENMITTDREITAPELLLPPVLFHEYREGWHLVVDLFKNDWMVNADKGRTIKVPVISNDLETGTEKKTFWEEIGMCQDDVEALGADLDILEGWSVGQPRSDEDDEEDSETDHSSNTSKTEDGSYVS
ncbi:hypothetical protein BJY04DRAFT_179172 [Aspergillus karnatakaensis]|uniref:uncharacterized protein n=1 Tax=Aspergillus karnatakaensis TaxID=1810916 RepID=UPI003CCCE312